MLTQSCQEQPLVYCRACVAGEFGTKMLLKQLQCGFEPVCGPIPAQEGKLEAQQRGAVQLNLREQGGLLLSMCP